MHSATRGLTHRSLMTIDVDRARADTPGCQHVTHFHHSGASLMPTPVLSAVKDHLDLEARIGGYEAAAEAVDKIDATYRAIACLLNCHTDEVAFVENATVAWDLAFYAIARGFGRGDRILTAVAEYASNYIAFLQLAKRSGVEIEVVPNDSHGQLDIEAMDRMIDERVRLIAITHVPTNGGLVNPAAEVGEIANTHGIPYLLDACQSVGQMNVDVQQIGCTMLSATGRKFLRGPRGTGFLYVQRAMIEGLEPPFLDLHAATWTTPQEFEIRTDARRFENFEDNVAGKIGLGVAVNYAVSLGLDNIYERIQMLAEELRRGLSTIPGVAVCDLGRERCGIVTFSHNAFAPQEIASRLRQKGINVGTSFRPSTLLDMDQRRITGLVRCAVHYFNTEEEIEQLVHQVAAL